MESRMFIEVATELRKDIAVFAAADLSDDEAARQGNAIQRRIDSAFSGLQNFTLPSVNKLCNEALAVGFQIDSRVMTRAGQAEHCWH